MSSFRKLYTIRTKLPGSYVKGKWVEGNSTSSQIMASFQPMGSNELLSMTIGRKELGKIKGYSNELLVVTNENTQTTGTIIEYQNSLYEIIAMDVNKSDVINHYKYIAEYRGINDNIGD